MTIISCSKESNNTTFNKNQIQKANNVSSATSQKTHDSLVAVADTSFGIHAPSKSSPWEDLSTSANKGLPPQSMQPLTRQGCNNGNYIATGISSGGMFSSFTTTFSNFGQVSNFSLSLSGMTIGWTWLTGTTTYTGNLSGTTYGAAQYNYGLINVTINYALDWSVNPESCTLFYSWRRL